MAEENHHGIYNEPSHDDMSVMKILLQSVKGISLISTPPVLEEVGIDE
ncbi:MAG TPA: hypothetical protein VGE13_02810 [Candidatus Saccharimonadales bacterium]